MVKTIIDATLMQCTAHYLLSRPPLIQFAQHYSWKTLISLQMNMTLKMPHCY